MSDRYYFTTTSRGTTLVATNETPFLCFEADTEDRAIELVKRALDFYEANHLTPTPGPSIDLQTTLFRTNRVIERQALEPQAA